MKSSRFCTLFRQVNNKCNVIFCYSKPLFGNIKSIYIKRVTAIDCYCFLQILMVNAHLA